MHKRTLHKILQIALLGASFFAVAAHADDEIEPNQPIASAESLAVDGGTGDIVVNGVIGNLTGAPVQDVDFYSFNGQEGDVVTVDIDGGVGGGGVRDVDTIVAIFGPAPSYTLLRAPNDDASYNNPLDPGSTTYFDARIENVRLPATGTYMVGVSAYPISFADGGVSQTVGSMSYYSNGDYTLVISGVTSPMLQINIDIKPGHGMGDAPINPKSKGKIPVALLSSAEFNAVTVKFDSLRFGPTGCEESSDGCQAKPNSCGYYGKDVNGDGRLDLVCHFDNKSAGFSSTDAEGIVTGETADGHRFEGRGALKVVPVKHIFK